MIDGYGILLRARLVGLYLILEVVHCSLSGCESIPQIL